MSRGNLCLSLTGPMGQKCSGAECCRSQQGMGISGTLCPDKGQAASVPGRLQVADLKARPSLTCCLPENPDTSASEKSNTSMVFQKAKHQPVTPLSQERWLVGHFHLYQCHRADGQYSESCRFKVPFLAPHQGWGNSTKLPNICCSGECEVKQHVPYTWLEIQAISREV